MRQEIINKIMNEIYNNNKTIKFKDILQLCNNSVNVAHDIEDHLLDCEYVFKQYDKDFNLTLTKNIVLNK